MSYEYPKAAVVWRGAILGSIVNSIMITESRDYISAQGWEGNSYWTNGWDGRRGAITFERGFLIGAFFSAKSDRAPAPDEDPSEYDLERFFQGCPSYQRDLAEGGALRFLLFQGFPGPLITAAFWDSGDYLSAADPWRVVLENGADLIETQLIEDVDEALLEWQDAYEMSCEQVQLARSLFERKIARPSDEIEAQPADVEILKSSCLDSEAMKLCRGSFAAIGIRVP